MRQKIGWRNTRVVIAVLLLVASVALAGDRDALYQVSTLDALLAGVYDRAISVGQLRQHGDFGLGCFEALDGEMVVLEGKVYQVRSDGSVHRATDHMGSPFAAVTFLDRDREVKVTQPTDFKGLNALVEAQLPSHNEFCVFRLDGEFEYVKTRSVPRQGKPYPKLADVAARQPTFEFHNVRGTIVGLFCPYYVTGANLAGYHFHFLTSARDGGGHLLDCRIRQGTLWLDPTPRYELVLPQSPEFLQLNPKAADTAAAKQVESDRK
jgi:acetolactate decarboxylase